MATRVIYIYQAVALTDREIDDVYVVRLDNRVYRLTAEEYQTWLKDFRGPMDRCSYSYPSVQFKIQEDIAKLMEYKHGFSTTVTPTGHEQRCERFDKAWTYIAELEAEKQRKDENPKTRQEIAAKAQAKALMIFDDNKGINGYDRSVFLYLAHRVKRMTFMQYLSEVQKPHNLTYDFQKMCMTDYTDPMTDYQSKVLRGNSLSETKEQTDMKVLSAFQYLWYKRTNDIISL